MLVYLMQKSITFKNRDELTLIIPIIEHKLTLF